MALSWISRSRGMAGVDALVARGRYAKAVKLLRAEFERRQPSIAERLRFADLLVLAGRGGEALPVLLGVADEQSRYGFRDKALEALRRAAEIDPGHPKVRNSIRALQNAPPADRPAPPPASGQDEAAGWGTALDGACASTAEPSGGEAAGPEPIASSDVGGEADPGPSTSPPPAADDDKAEPYLSELTLEPEEPELVLVEADGEPEEREPLVTVAAEPDEPRPLLTEAELDEAEREARVAEPPVGERALHRYLLALGRTPGAGAAALGPALFADFPPDQIRSVSPGLRRRRFAPGDVLVTEGEPGDSLFLIARGSVRVLVVGGHGQPLDIRRLDAGDFFGEVAVLSGWPRTATVVAATAGETLEIGRAALDVLLALRPDAQRLLEEIASSRAQSPEEKAVRLLPPEAADPECAAAVLRAHFGRSDWSLRVRLHLAQLMLDVGRHEEALAILAGVAEDLARHGHAQKAIAVLRRVESIRRRGIHTIPLAPLQNGRRRSVQPRPAPPPGAAVPAPAASRAASGAAFREWVGSLLRKTHALASRPASSPVVEEGAEGDGERHRFAGRSA